MGDEAPLDVYRALAARDRRDRLRDQVKAMERVVTEAKSQLERCAPALRAAEAELAELESVGRARLAAIARRDYFEERDRLRARLGDRQDEFDRARDRLDRVRTQRVDLHEELSRIGDIDAAVERAIGAYATWVVRHDPALGARLADLTNRLASLGARERALGRAESVGDQAVQILYRLEVLCDVAIEATTPWVVDRAALADAETHVALARHVLARFWPRLAELDVAPGDCPDLDDTLIRSRPLVRELTLRWRIWRTRRSATATRALVRDACGTVRMRRVQVRRDREEVSARRDGALAAASTRYEADGQDGPGSGAPECPPE